MGVAAEPELDVLVAADDVPELVLVLVLGVLSDDFGSPEASAEFSTAETRPKVMAAAETVATAAATRPRSCRRFGVSFGFIPVTMPPGSSAPRHHSVKCPLSLAGTS